MDHDVSRPDKILVTGGAGFIGSHLVQRLLADTRRVRVLDNLSTGTIGNLEGVRGKPEFELFKGDLLDPMALESALEGVHAVVHLAAQTSVAASVKDPVPTMRTNVHGTRNLLDRCRALGVRKFVFASSCAVYGNPRELPLKEDSPLAPLSPYAASKSQGETMCSDASSAFPAGMTILRFFNVYGPRQAKSEYGGVIARFIDSLTRGSPPVIYGDGHQTRDFVYESDVVDSIVLCLASRGGFEVFNVGTGTETSVLDVERLVSEILGAGRTSPSYLSPRTGEVQRSVADISRAKKVLGYSPKVTIESGLRKMMEEAIAR